MLMYVSKINPNDATEYDMDITYTIQFMKPYYQVPAQ